MASTVRGSATGLARGALGVTEVAFQGMTHMGPAVAVTSAIPLAFLFGGGSAPLAVLFAFAACLLVASSMGQLSKHLPSAGGMYTYSANGLHPAVGFMVAWMFSLAELAVSPLLWLLLALTITGELNADFNYPMTLWWIWVVVLAAIVLALGYRGIRVPAGAGVVLGAIEIAVFTVLCIWLIIRAGGNNTLAVFGTGYATQPGLLGFKGVAAAAIFTVLAYIGFEEAIPLSEEARHPGRTVQKALMIALVGVGLLFVLAAYAGDVYFGPANGVHFADFNGGNPWIGIAKNVWGGGWVLVFIIIIESYVANCNAASLSITRTWYSMGRIRILPSVLARLHPRYQTPQIALFVQVGLGLVLTLILGIAFGVLEGALLAATLITDIFVLVYIAVNLSCFAYYWRFRRNEFNWLLHGVIPFVGIIAFIPIFFASAGIPVFDFISPLKAPESFGGPAAAVWFVVGLIYLGYLYNVRPKTVADTASVFVSDDDLSVIGTTAIASASGPAS